jgi:hypothetical protein
MVGLSMEIDEAETARKGVCFGPNFSLVCRGKASQSYQS